MKYLPSAELPEPIPHLRHDRVDWCGGNIVHLSGIMTEDFRGFPQSFQANSRVVYRLGHHRFLPNPFQFSIIINPSIRLLCNLNIDAFYCFRLHNSWYTYTIRFFPYYMFRPDVSIFRYIRSHSHLFLFLLLSLHWPVFTHWE
jgi:hypothetical protein